MNTSTKLSLARIVIALVVLTLNFTAQRALAQDSLQVAAWGRNGYGQLWVPQNLPGVKAVAPGYDFTLALLDNGTVTVWGGTAAWQTNLPPGLTNIAAISACWSHCLALRSNGTVVGWGNAPILNSMISSSTVRSQVTNPPLTSVKAIAAGGGHSVLVQSNGTLTAYGVWGGAMQSSVGSVPGGPPTSVANVATSDDYYIALRNDGTVAVRGTLSAQSLLTPPAGLAGIKSVAAGSFHCLALGSNGTVVAWGLNNSGATNIPSTLSSIVAIAAGDSHNLALDSEGKVTSWGSGVFGENIVPSGLTNVASLAASFYYSMALVSNTSIVISKQPKGATVFSGRSYRLGCTATGSQPLHYQWLRNNVDLEAATNSTLLLSNVSDGDAGEYTVVITNSIGSVTSAVANVTLGPLVVWGGNFGEQCEPPAFINNPVAIAASVDSGVSPWAAVSADGKVVTWSSDVGPVPESLSNVVQVAAGYEHLVALKSDGTIEAWGEENFGQLDVPPGLTNVISVTTGGTHSMVLNRDGSVVAWGSGVVTNVPAGLNNVSAVSVGSFASFALLADGTIRAWGSGSLTNIPPGLTNITAISVGSSFMGLAIRTDGTVVRWGFGDAPPAGLSNVVAVASGRPQALALREDGTLVAWGPSSTGATTIPDGLSNVVAITAGSDVNAAIVGDGRPAFPTRIPKRSVHAGGTLQLPALASSSVPMSYQWFFNGQPIENQTNSLLQIPNAAVTLAGDYTVVASNVVGVVTSAVTTVTVTRDPLRFDTTPAGLNVTNEMTHLKLTGLAGAGPIVLYTTTNLSEWEPIHTNPPVVGTLEIADPAFTNNAVRFYQAVEGP